MSSKTFYATLLLAFTMTAAPCAFADQSTSDETAAQENAAEERSAQESAAQESPSAASAPMKRAPDIILPKVKKSQPQTVLYYGYKAGHLGAKEKATEIWAQLKELAMKGQVICRGIKDPSDQSETPRMLESSSEVMERIINRLGEIKDSANVVKFKTDDELPVIEMTVRFSKVNQRLFPSPDQRAFFYSESRKERISVVVSNETGFPVRFSSDLIYLDWKSALTQGGALVWTESWPSLDNSLRECWISGR